jgi:hypothetical protein
MSWLEALKNLDTETTQETEIATDAASSRAGESSDSLIQQGDKSAKSPDAPLLALLSPCWIEDSENLSSEEEAASEAISTSCVVCVGSVRASV